MIAPQDQFWTINVGSVLQILTFVIGFIAFHLNNVKNVRTNASEFQELKTKVDFIYEWFCNNISIEVSHRKQNGR